MFLLNQLKFTSHGYEGSTYQFDGILFRKRFAFLKENLRSTEEMTNEAITRRLFRVASTGA